MNKIDHKTISENIFKLIGSDWMLVTAGSKQKFNTMTASWGGMGVMWNKPCAFVFIRPQRYTFEFIEKNDGFSLSFFGKEYREALNICGAKSGRDCDKVALAKLTARFTENGLPCFDEAKLVLECRKMYADMMDPKYFIDKTQIDRWHGDGTFHKFYIAEIVNAFAK